MTHGVTQASTVLEYARDLADAVLVDDKPLNEACQEAQRRKAEAQSDEARINPGSSCFMVAR
jgi:hypothetical protein